MGKKVFLFLFVTLALSCLVSALQISVNPTDMVLKVQTEKEVCINITVSSDQATIILVSDKWGRSKSDQINSYGMTRDQLAIKAFVPDKVIIGAKEEKDVEVCFTPGGEGTFYGVIVFESFNKQAVTGSFIELKSSYQTSMGDATLLGMTHQDIKPVDPKQTLIAISFLNTLFLICVLIYLLRAISRKKKKKKSKRTRVIEVK
ncbi:Uncharacterised protein [uncultured archaeon]|nr:Uncharacterised protein [uncultured archaeon]